MDGDVPTAAHSGRNAAAGGSCDRPWRSWRRRVARLQPRTVSWRAFRCLPTVSRAVATLHNLSSGSLALVFLRSSVMAVQSSSSLQTPEHDMT